MRWYFTLAIGLLGGFAGAALWGLTPYAGQSTRTYLMANPEILPEAMGVLDQRQRQARIEPVRDQLELAFPGAVLGNPDGAVTLVEFSDYACGYCRASVPDVKALVAANPDLRIVMKEFPILRPESADAARMALAAAQQGKYAAFHDAMFDLGNPTAETIAAAARAAGVDLAKANAAIAAGQFDPFLQDNHELAAKLGIGGTPGWVIGDRVIDGAVGEEELAKAVAEARKS
ncbi:DsbA family protein [Tsuneonella sp. HG222]